MFVSRVDPENLNTKRLDSDFYRPEYLDIENTLLNLQTCPLGQVGHFFTGPFGSKLPSNLYLDKGIPLFRVGNVGQFEVLVDNFAHLSPTVHEELNASEVKSGDLLIVKASVGEKICKVPDWLPKANITQHVIAIRPNGSHDTDYVSAFLFSKFGVTQLQRYSLGSIIQYLGVTDAKSVLLFNADRMVQQYIGDKVRQAEQLRAWAKAQLQEIARLTTNEELNAACKTPLKSYNRPQLQDLSNRLDPKYYGNRAIAVEHQIRISGKSLGSLIKDISNGFEERNFVTEGIDYITVSEVSSGRIDLNNAPKIPTTTVVPDKAQIHECCVLVVRTGSIGTAAKVNSLDKSAVISSHLIRLEFADEATAASVAAFLNSEAGKILQHKISYGAVQPQIGQEELLALPVPQFILDRGEQILIRMEAYESAIRCAKSLTTASKHLVEALIEGQLIEQQQLITAQLQLQAADYSTDQAILSRLKTDGFDGDGPALFSDLEQLYTLLDQAKESDSWTPPA